MNWLFSTNNQISVKLVCTNFQWKFISCYPSCLFLYIYIYIYISENSIFFLYGTNRMWISIWILDLLRTIIKDYLYPVKNPSELMGLDDDRPLIFDLSEVTDYIYIYIYHIELNLFSHWQALLFPVSSFLETEVTHIHTLTEYIYIVWYIPTPFHTSTD